MDSCGWMKDGKITRIVEFKGNDARILPNGN